MRLCVVAGGCRVSSRQTKAAADAGGDAHAHESHGGEHERGASGRAFRRRVTWCSAGKPRRSILAVVVVTVAAPEGRQLRQ